MAMELKTVADRYNIFRVKYEPLMGCEGCSDALMQMGFFEAPASTKYHGAYSGGLFDHSVNVTRNLMDLTKKLKLRWRSPYSPVRIGMLHDLCKADQYILVTSETDGSSHYEFNKYSMLKGHGDKSVMLASQLMVLTEEEVLCIRYHMGSFCEKEEWNLYTDAVHAYENVLYTHMADMMAAHVDEAHMICPNET